MRAVYRTHWKSVKLPHSSRAEEDRSDNLPIGEPILNFEHTTEHGKRITRLDRLGRRDLSNGSWGNTCRHLRALSIAERCGADSTMIVAMTVIRQAPYWP